MTGKCGWKRKTTPRLDRKIKAVVLKSTRASCKNLSTEMWVLWWTGESSFKCLLGQGLKSHMRRKSLV